MAKRKQPRAERENHVEQIGPHRIEDPYRYLERDTPAVRAWVRAQQEDALELLCNLPGRKDLRERLDALMTHSNFTTPVQKGDLYFYRDRPAGQELSVLYVQQGLDGAPRPLIDPNKLSQDHTTTLFNIHPSSDGTLMAYRLSEAGRSLMTLHVVNVLTGEVLPDVIPAELNPVAHAWHTKNTVVWAHDNSGFHYTRRPVAVPRGEERYHQKLYFHRLGDDHVADQLVFGEALTREQSLYPQLSADGRYLMVVVQDFSGDEPFSELYILDFESQNRGFLPVIKGVKAFFHATIYKDAVYIKTHHNAPLGKIEAFQLTDLKEGVVELKTVIPEGKSPLAGWQVAKNYLFVETIENVSSRLRVFGISGEFVKEIGLPDIGTITAMNAEPEGNQLFFAFSSFVTPKAVYQLDLETHEYMLYRRHVVDFDPSLFEVRQVWYESRDKTSIPMFLVYKRGIEQNGDNPTVVYGYGGFNVSVMPSFSPHIIPFLERGGIYAVANIRGGGELGEEWHRGGMRENKQNVFDDFIGAAEWLIAEAYTNASRLGCFGWSNGGLLVNTVAVQRPDLWKAVAAGAPVTDMARFHRSEGGRHCIADYGDPDNPGDLDFLLKYSPYHNLPKEIDAPAILMLVSDGDDRVAPWHGYKMLAAWQAANVSDRPILLRGEDKSGHKGGASASKTVARYTDMWAFLFWQLNVRQ